MKKTNKNLAKAALSGLILATSSQIATAGAPSWAKSGDQLEKCAAVAAKGKNDCAAGKHKCMNHSGDKWAGAQEWVYVPAGLCAKIKGGKVVGKKTI